MLKDVATADSQLGALDSKAISWVEGVIRGRIVSAQLQARWARQHWFLTAECEGGHRKRLLLRSKKNGGYAADVKERLHREAVVLNALQNTGVLVPKYYAYNQELGWLLQEWVHGEVMISDVTNPDVQHSVFRQYIDQLVTLHRLNPDKLDLSSVVPRPRDSEHSLTEYVDAQFKMYESYAPTTRDPLITLAKWWLKNNKPAPRTQLSLCLGDVGADQFLFEDGKLKTIFDFEMARVQDHYFDIGMMRLRTICYYVPDLPGHIDYYFEKLGESMDPHRVQYYTLIALIQAELTHYRGRYQASTERDPEYTDYIQMWGSDVNITRGTAELMMEIYGFTPTPPALPKSPAKSSVDIYEILRHRMELRRRAAQGDDLRSFQAGCDLALAQTLLLMDREGPQFNAESLDELTSLLGRRPASLTEGMDALAGEIGSNPERDLKRRLQFLYNYHVRLEYLYAPFSEATHAATFRWLAPLNKH